MTLPHPKTAQPVLRLLAASLTVLLAVAVGSMNGGHVGDRPTYHHYVALGDSFTAAPFVPLTDAARGCYRSRNNYPHQVALDLHVEDLQDRSCTGAQTKDMTGPQLTALRQRVPAQFGALSGRTDLVTVGIGANDGHLYARLATECRRSTRICKLHDQRVVLGEIVDRLEATLTQTLTEVKGRAPHARVLLVGYPKLLPARGDCAKLPRMRPQDRATFRDINLRLRLAMHDAAEAAEVEFVDFYAVSYDHDVCAPHPWIQGRLGDARLAAALHPLPAGQAALARLVERTLIAHPPSDEDR